MRSNSGKDEARNNLRDPTLREREKTKVEKIPADRDAETTEMGSGARKSGQEGEK